MREALIAKYGGPVPRYTSYPTAPHFGTAVGPADYGAWLAALPAEVRLSLYVHIPFCDTLCWFCGCHTKIVRRYEPVAAYFEVLIAELRLVAERLGRPRPVSHVHLGGGSPTILRGHDHARLADALAGAFALEADAEIAIEIDPRGIAAADIAALAAAGVTRASIGVQDFEPQVQQAINRIQPFEETAAVVGMLRGAGIERLNLDLMFGLPHQSVETLSRTLEQAMTLQPSRIALFGYAHVPQMKTHQRLMPEDALPGPAERWAQSEAAAEFLVAAGYRRIGLDHFARPDDSLTRALDKGRLRRNFQGYTDDAAPALLGLGASSIGELPQGYVQNQVPMRAYAEAIGAGALATAKGIALDGEDRLRRAVIERLMCDLSVDLDALCAEHGADAAGFDGELARLDGMARDGLVQRRGREIRVPEEGRALLRSVACVFDSYLGRGQARHSQAV